MKRLFPLMSVLVLLGGCREVEVVVPTEYELVNESYRPESDVKGMYLVNEGNMGSNKCTLDYLDFENGWYARNLYAEKNPHVVKELGDVGNDIRIYGSRLYVVVNCSNKVEVLNARTGVRIGQIEIPNCRYIRFYRGKAYVSAYVGPVQLYNPDAVKGAVYKVDTLSLQVEGKVTVGYQPDELEVLGEYLFVANSGGYMAPNYDNTVSMIELEGFRQVRKIPVGINLHRIRADRYGRLWVTSRGNYENIPSNLYVLERKKNSVEMVVTDTLGIPCSNLFIQGDSLYYYSTEWNNFTQRNTITYGIIDIKTKRKVSDSFIKDGTDGDITIPYGIAVHPETGDIFVTDAKNYVSSGTLYCYTRDGVRKWKVRTGDIPAHMCFLTKSQKKK
ncbi:MAG: YncE family protein [Prevotellaceae bacterium]|nr:YncE family protein [Prevotella sp.]MDD7529980.1 YncE family protein [Prevotellaceae bacterium]MDY2633748.1 YncE family protein [Prevotella sp.]